jgi:hypothetical protein
MSTDDRKEQRKYQRLNRPLEGSWRGSSGQAVCRITDISLGGCFLQSLASPAIGEETFVTIRIDDARSLTLKGAVVYVETGMGFAVEFGALNEEDSKNLQAVIDAIRAGK